VGCLGPEPAALVWGGHVRYGTGTWPWRIGWIFWRLPTVSCHGDHSPDTSARANLVRRWK